MMENHSFDNALGFLGKGDGLKGKEFNLINPNDPTSQPVYVSDDAVNTTDPDPLHELMDTSTQILGPNRNILLMGVSFTTILRQRMAMLMSAKT